MGRFRRRSLGAAALLAWGCLPGPLGAQEERFTLPEPRPFFPGPPKPPPVLEPLRADLPNHAQVHAWLHRGAQPGEKGLTILAGKGIRTVVNLRLEDDLAEKEGEAVRALGLRYVRLPMSPVGPPPDKDVEAFLDLMKDYENYPVFLHCKRGADRTGALVAAYRIEFDRWKPMRAAGEMVRHGAVDPGHLKFVFDFYQRRNPPDPSRDSLRPGRRGRPLGTAWPARGRDPT